MQFSVPQYIQIKQKIIGPLTLSQFSWIAAGFTVSFLSFFKFKPWLSFPLALIAITISICFAFIEINGQPLSKIFGFFLKFQLGQKIYFWERKEETEEVIIKETKIDLEKGLALKEIFKNLLLVSTSTKKERSKTKYQVFRGRYGEREIGKRVDYL